MVAQNLHVEVLTPEKALAGLDAQSVNAPGFLGYVEILPNHAPYVTELDVGVLKVDDQNYFVAGGYLEVLDNKVKVLADVLETVDDIDVSRAEAAKERALKRLNERLAEKNEPLDMERAQKALKRAQTRLDFRVLNQRTAR